METTVTRPADALHDLNGLLHSVVVPLVHRVNEVIALDVRAVGLDLDLVLGGVGHPLDTHQNLHHLPPLLSMGFRDLKRRHR
jgi:hypothetical protein